MRASKHVINFQTFVYWHWKLNRTSRKCCVAFYFFFRSRSLLFCSFCHLLSLLVSHTAYGMNTNMFDCEWCFEWLFIHVPYAPYAHCNAVVYIFPSTSPFYYVDHVNKCVSTVHMYSMFEYGEHFDISVRCDPHLLNVWPHHFFPIFQNDFVVRNRFLLLLEKERSNAKKTTYHLMLFR